MVATCGESDGLRGEEGEEGERLLLVALLQWHGLRDVSPLVPFPC